MKTKTMLTRGLLLALIAATLLCCFAGCSGGGDPVSTTAATTGDDNLDDKGKIKDKVPDGLNFGQIVKLFACENQKAHYYAEEDTNDNVGQAVYIRNQKVADRLGIELEWKFQACYSSGEKSDFALAIETDCKNDKSIDVVVTYNLVPYRISWKGYLTNLNSTKYIDLSAPWWPPEYLENMLYRGKIYALVNNVGYGTLQNLTGIFFNNTMLEAKGIESPYEVVKRNEWTLSTLREMTKDTYQDANNNGKKDHEDIYGVSTSTKVRLTCWYYGAGIRMSKLDENGQLVMTGGETEKIDGAIRQILSLFDTNNGYTSNQDGGKMNEMFAEERAYFYLSTFALAEKIAKEELEINYGIVPTPKLNSDQSRYYIHIPNMHDAWCIPNTAKNQECSSAVIELMASEAYREVTDVYYEKNLKLRYAPDERLADMYDLIRQSIVFDFVYIHKESMMGNDCDSNLIKCIHQPSSYNWYDIWSSVGSSAQGKFDELVAIYDTLE